MWEKAKNEGYVGTHVAGMHTEVDANFDYPSALEYCDIEQSAWDWYDCNTTDIPEHFGEIVAGFNDVGIDTSEWSTDYILHMDRMGNLPCNPLADS